MIIRVLLSHKSDQLKISLSVLEPPIRSGYTGSPLIKPDRSNFLIRLSRNLRHTARCCKRVAPTFNEHCGYSSTALQRASERGHKEVVRLLLEKGARFHAEAGDGGLRDDSVDDGACSIYPHCNESAIERETRDFDEETHIPDGSGDLPPVSPLAFIRLDNANTDNPFAVDAPEVSVEQKRIVEDLILVLHI